MRLRAQWVLPIQGPPIPDGLVTLDQGRIQSVGARPPGGTDLIDIDLGPSVLLPGLINAHCHLDYTDLRAQVPYRGSFLDWILQLVAHKKHWTPADYLASYRHGLDQLPATGATTVLDIVSTPALLPQVGPSLVPVLACPELLDLTWSPESLRALEAALGLPDIAGLSPHAPYTVSAPFYRLVAQTARERGLLLTTHAAESLEEDQMWRYSRGPMFERYQRGATHGAIRELANHDVLGPNCLLAHANYLTADDAALLARTGTSVVHCPRTHRFFQRPPAPLDLWRQAGLNICLGTDSLASNDSLSLLAELSALACAWPMLPPAQILQMATVNPARALNRTGELGLLAAGARADLIAVPACLADPYESVLAAAAPSFVMVHGRMLTP